MFLLQFVTLKTGCNVILNTFVVLLKSEYSHLQYTIRDCMECASKTINLKYVQNKPQNIQKYVSKA